MTKAERWLQWGVIAGAVSFAVEAAMYVPEVFRGPAATRPYAINSVSKDVLFFALTAVAAADLRRWSRLIGFVILGHVVILTLLVLAIATGNTAFAFPPPRWLAELAPFTDPSEPARAWIWLGLCAGATALLVWLYHRALRERYRLKYLWPLEHDTLAAVADATLDDPRMKPADIATAIDSYWAGLDIGYKTRLRAALWLVYLLPLRWLRPPLPYVARERRRDLIENKMLRAISSRSGLGPLRTMAQSAIRFAMQLTYIGYYNDPASYEGTGYERFSDRRDDRGDRTPYRPERPLRTLAPPAPGARPMRTKIAIVGSGAGGSIAAHVLAEAGHEVLMVERGRHVDPDTFSEDEAEQYGRLYSDGALQLSRDFSFQVLQGMCVGGGTVVNNAICIDPPVAVLERWYEEYDSGLLPDDVLVSTLTVRDLIGASSQGHAPPNGVVPRLRPAPFDAVSANIRDCLGAGYCNIGCKYGRKLSMLDRVLPDTQRETDDRRARDPDFRGSLEILPDCEVTEVRTREGRATGLSCQLRLPGGKRRSIEIDADVVILAAGAIHSSRLLMQSGIGGDLVGRELCANIGSHMTGAWRADEPPVRAFDGLQMSHILRDAPAAEPEYLIEAWFNPLMSQALVMPGWLRNHQDNMERYDRLGVLGVITASTPNGNRVLRRRAALSGAEIDFTPSRKDLQRLLRGLRHAGEVLLEHGADSVMPLTFEFREFFEPGELARLEHIDDPSDISVNTAHPQGGNRISRDPRRGVVDERFRVHGLRNLYVMDASVFPTAVGVNPQLSVMALSHYAASAIA